MSEIDEVKRKALKSAKWMVITSVLSMLFSYISNILLGNISAEMLGIYSAVNVFISSLTTFVGMGGAIVLSNFIPKTEAKEDKTRLLYTYTAISFAMYGVMTAAILLFPELNLLLSGGLEGTTKYIALFVMAPVFVVKTVISYLLIAFLEARISNIMTKLYTFVLVIVLLVMFFVNETLIEKYLVLIVFCADIFSNVLAIALGFSFIKKEKLLVKATGFYVPKGFWLFTVSTFLQALFSFLYRNADKMFLISLGDMGQLGYYQALISILTLVEFVPSLLGNVNIPYFSNMIKLGNKKEVESSYERIEKYMLFFLVSCVLGVISLSDVALGMFGQDYLPYKYLLVILVCAKCIASLGFTNTPMLVVLEKNHIRFFNSLGQILIQFTITFLSVNKLGILGVVLGRTIGVCLAQIAPQLIVKYKSGYNIKLSRAYFAGIFCAVALGVAQTVCNFSLTISILLGFFVWTGFLFLGGFTKKDFKHMISMLLKR